MLKLISKSAALLPQAIGGQLGWLRGAVGAALGIALAGAITMIFIGIDNPSLPWLVAPLGASAVLVFAVPASPLAQPWAVIGGDLLSASVGLAAGMLIHQPLISASIAVGLAIALMSLARCLHPPGGACALLCALGAAGAEQWSWWHMWPIAANVFALVVVGWAYNNFTGHAWPHKMMQPTQGKPKARDIQYTRHDLEAVLAEWDEVLDVDVDDLDALYQAVHRRVLKRRVSR